MKKKKKKKNKVEEFQLANPASLGSLASKKRIESPMAIAFMFNCVHILGKVFLEILITFATDHLKKWLHNNFVTGVACNIYGKSFKIIHK